MASKARHLRRSSASSSGRTARFSSAARCGRCQDRPPPPPAYSRSAQSSPSTCIDFDQLRTRFGSRFRFGAQNLPPVLRQRLQPHRADGASQRRWRRRCDAPATRSGDTPPQKIRKAALDRNVGKVLYREMRAGRLWASIAISPAAGSDTQLTGGGSLSHSPRARAVRVSESSLHALPNHATVSEETCLIPICMTR